MDNEIFCLILLGGIFVYLAIWLISYIKEGGDDTDG